jgi:mannonate dehydratase
MRPGLALYRDMLTPANFRFARQVGATDVVAHLASYETTQNPEDQRRSGLEGSWGTSSAVPAWTVDDLSSLRRSVESEGLRLAAIENFEVAHWYDVLLDGPHRQRQMEGLKKTIANLGRAGIPAMGYYFSVAGHMPAEVPFRRRLTWAATPMLCRFRVGRFGT